MLIERASQQSNMAGIHREEEKTQREGMRGSPPTSPFQVVLYLLLDTSINNQSCFKCICVF